MGCFHKTMMGGEKSRVPGTHFAVSLLRDFTFHPFCSLQPVRRMRGGTLLTAGAGTTSALHSPCVLCTHGLAMQKSDSHDCECFTKSMISTSAWQPRGKRCRGSARELGQSVTVQ